jgi:hypothetical protein
VVPNIASAMTSQAPARGSQELRISCA